MQEIMLRKWRFFKKTQTFSEKRLDFPKKKCIIYLLRANRIDLRETDAEVAELADAHV